MIMSSLPQQYLGHGVTDDVISFFQHKSLFCAFLYPLHLPFMITHIVYVLTKLTTDILKCNTATTKSNSIKKHGKARESVQHVR